MSHSQHHGKGFEGGVIFAGVERAGCRHHFTLRKSNTAKFDISSYDDPDGEGIPTSIKTMKAGRNRIDLADACRISNLRHHAKTDHLMDPPPEMLRLMVGIFKQAGAKKTFYEAREYIVTRQEWETLWGDIPHGEVEKFSHLVKEGSKDAARKAAKAFNLHVKSLYPDAAIKLSPKISDKNNAEGKFVRQRRVQCGVSLVALEAAIVDKSRIRVYAEPSKDHEARPDYLKPQSDALWGSTVTFPFDLESSARQFNR